MTNHTNHYQELYEKWRGSYLAMDRTALKERFHLRADSGAHYITYYRQEYRIDQQNGSLTLSGDPNRQPPLGTAIQIYTLFHYAKPDAFVCGQFVPFREVKRAAPFDPAFQRTIIAPFCKAFNGHAELLRRSCEILGGKPVSRGDAGYIIHAFDWMPVMMIFWDGDDEFDAQATLLFDANITDFIHEESVVGIGADLVRRLREEAGIG